MTDETSPHGPRPVHDSGAAPKPEGPVIDVEPDEAPDAASSDETGAPEPPPAPPAGAKLRLSPWHGVVGLGLLVVAGIVLLFAIPWRQPQDISGFRQTVSDRLSSIDGRLKALETAPAPPPAAEPAGDFGALEARLGKLEEAAAHPQPVPSLSDVDALRTRIATLEARATADQEARAALAAQIDVLANSDAAHSAHAAMLALAASALDDAIHRGQGFREELALIEQLQPGDVALVKLEPFAEEGIEPVASLADAFSTYSHAAQQAVTTSEAPHGAWDTVVKFFAGFVTVRDAGVAQNTPASETLNAMRLALSQGDVARAVALSDALPAAAQSSLAPWVARARAHASALRAAGELRQRVIGQLVETALQRDAPPPQPGGTAPTTPQ